MLAHGITIKTLPQTFTITQQRTGRRRSVTANILKDKPASNRRLSREPGQSSESALFGEVLLRSFDVVQLPPEAVLLDGEEPLKLADWGEPKAALVSPDKPVKEGPFTGSLKGMLLLNLGALLFGSNQVVIKLTEESMSPNALSATRFAIAAACFAPTAIKGFKNPALRNAALELGLWLYGGYTAQALGLGTTTAARGAFTGTFTVVAVPILVGLSGRRVSWTTWLAAVVALTGVGLLTTSGADPNMGDALCILSAILFGVHKWRTETVTAQFDNTRELIAVQLAVLAGASAMTSVPDVVHAVQKLAPSELWALAAGLPWPALVYMGLATTALTLWIEMHSLREVSAPLAALIYTAEPLWGALFAYAVLQERWGATGWAGAVLIIAASLGSQLAGDGTEKPVVRKAGDALGASRTGCETLEGKRHCE